MEELVQLISAAIILNQHQGTQGPADEHIHRSISFPAKTWYPRNDDPSFKKHIDKEGTDVDKTNQPQDNVVPSWKTEETNACHPSRGDLEQAYHFQSSTQSQKERQEGLTLRSIVQPDSMDRTSSFKKLSDSNDTDVRSTSCQPRMHYRPDGRLFPNDQLYCEGLPKPKLRGAIHLFYALILPFGIYLLWKEANGNLYGQIAGVVFASSNLYCVGMSAFYHIGNWSKQTEIFIQKLDHCGISIYAAGVNFPCSLMLMPGSSGVALLTLSVVSCSWTCYHIFNNRPAVWRFVVVSLCIVLYVPVLFFVMSTFEFSCGCLNAIIQGAGMMVFVAQKPDPWPTVFGYHELFHLICILGMTVTFMCNWSIIRRTCNPYAVHADILDLVEEYLDYYLR